ncbi:unnamed protein product [marine sediment metagenome]|uniref:Uncharacterized protein n=1 Tax=marine sediment metagenome TaxID=412755 RepID=X1CDF3_9ZZZZ
MKKDGEMYKEVKVPRIAINDDFVELVEWYVNDGTHVEEGTQSSSALSEQRLQLPTPKKDALPQL